MPVWRRALLLSAFLYLVLLLLTLVGTLLQATGRAAELPSRSSSREALWTKERVNLLVVGTDYRPEEHGGYLPPFRKARPEQVRSRADTIILLHLDPSGPRAALLSIPRDTVVTLPGRGRDKVNHALQFGGIRLLRESVEAFTGLTVDRYVMVDFQGFAGLIDAIGGIEYEVEHDLYGPDGRVWLKAGRQHLDGRTALRLVRHRYREPRGDLSRVERQQRFLLALARRLQEGGFYRAYSAYLESPNVLKTDLTTREILWLYRSLRRLDPAAVPLLTVPGRPQSHYYLPDPAGLQRVLGQLRDFRAEDGAGR